MSQAIPIPETIWIITGQTQIKEIPDSARTGKDRGGYLGDEVEIEKTTVTKRQAVAVDKLKQEMKSFLQAMREMLEEADTPDAKMQLDEVELSVEINGEGEVSLLGIGGKAGGKGAMTFKFKRRDGG